MVNAINSNINSIQFHTATNAFKAAAAKPVEEIKEIEPEISEGIATNEDSILKKLDLEDVKKYASLVGENDISEDDIKYGLTYGRSVLADWLV